MSNKSIDFEELKGKVISSIVRSKEDDDNDRLLFTLENGEQHVMHYHPD